MDADSVAFRQWIPTLDCELSFSGPNSLVDYTMNERVRNMFHRIINGLSRDNVDVINSVFSFTYDEAIYHCIIVNTVIGNRNRTPAKLIRVEGSNVDLC